MVRTYYRSWQQQWNQTIAHTTTKLTQLLFKFKSSHSPSLLHSQPLLAPWIYPTLRNILAPRKSMSFSVSSGKLKLIQVLFLTIPDCYTHTRKKKKKKRGKIDKWKYYLPLFRCCSTILANAIQHEVRVMDPQRDSYQYQSRTSKLCSIPVWSQVKQSSFLQNLFRKNIPTPFPNNTPMIVFNMFS